MSDAAKDRANEIDETIKIASENLKTAEEVKKKLVTASSDIKSVGFRLDTYIENERTFVGYLSQVKQEAIIFVSDENWKRIQSVKQDSILGGGTISGILAQTNDLGRNLGTINALASGTTSFSVTASYVVGEVFNSSEIPKQFRLIPIGFTDPLSDDVSLIVHELQSVEMDLAGKFDEAIKEWSLGTPNSKTNVLLAIRSIVFSQLFEEKFAIESDYARTAWFRF